MTANITPIAKPFAPDDIPKTLRRIADQFEAGEYGLMTTCVVVMGHTEHKDDLNGGPRIQRERHKLFGCGPRCDSLTVCGLLTTAATHPLED